MTVKSLTDLQKSYIGDLYRSQIYTIPELALLYERSRRTIIRALDEQGAYTIKRRIPKPKLLPVAIQTNIPWYQRAATVVKSFFVSLATVYFGYDSNRTEYRP